MEEMLGQVMRPPICLRNLLEDFKAVKKTCKQPSSDDHLRAAMNMENDPDRFKAAEMKSLIKNLEQVDDVRVSSYTPGFSETNRRTMTVIPDQALQLQTFKKLMCEKEKNIKNPFERTRFSFKSILAPQSEDHSITDLLIYVRVYRPARATHMGKRLEKPVFAEEFQCLGSNLLTELRDKIACVCNKKRFFDISNNPTEELVDKKTDPGYFFITDTFYNDKRNNANADYSETVCKWAKTAKGLSELNFKTALMENTRFIDLTVSLGFPQLYQHHGNCEHVFVFSQIEFLTPSTPSPPQSSYPLLSAMSNFNMRTCNMCGQRAYVFIVEQSNRQLHDPAFLCSKCFYGFHYVDGKKLGNFKAYRVNDYEAGVGENGAELDGENEEGEDDTISEQDYSQSSFSCYPELSDDQSEFQDINVKTEHEES